MSIHQSRRGFLTKVTAASIGSKLLPRGKASGGEIPYRTLGATGAKVSAIGLGGYHIGQQKDESLGIAIIRGAIDNGINFMDNCWDYNDGASEERMGRALQNGYRQKVFLMTKIDGRTKDAAARQIDQSLQRLRTGHVDLVQFHEIIRLEDPDRIFGPGGAAEAMLAAQKAGKVRFIGFTGHKDPDIHLKMFEVARQHSFHFDVVQMPLNVMDVHYHSFARKVVPVAQAANTAVISMKPLGGGVILRSNAAVTPVEALHYAMNLPTSVVITGCDTKQVLDQAVQAARTFKPLSKQEVAAIEQKTAGAGKDGKYELFKTTAQFDGTAQHPEWLG